MSKSLIISLSAILALVLGWLVLDYCQLAKQDEAQRMRDASDMLIKKLATDYLVHGRYPAALDSLSFTNSADEIQTLPYARKIIYRCLDGGHNYSIAYRRSWSNYIVHDSYNLRPTLTVITNAK